MKLKIPFGSLLFFIALTACRQNSPPAATNPTTKPASTVSAAASPTLPVGNNALPEVKAKYYNGTGVVRKINMEIGSVELDHEEIKDIMPKMIMEFYVADKSELKDLKIGDRVDFVLEDKGGAERISSIKKAEQGKRQK
ncbi:MAG TPA: copper-binding protein [Pyrinomonadaceae bacterium]|jgi:Cu/Ag efflux protein CusF